MKKLNVIILFMVVLLASCTKKVGMTSSKIKLFGSNAFSTGSTLETLANNGLIFYGTSTDGKTFSKRIDTDTADLVFPNGTWSFFAVAWEQASATSPFQGKVRCAKQLGVVLNGSDTTISLTLDNAKCADSAFTANSYNTGTQVLLPQRNFIGCKDQTLATNYSDTAACTLNSQASNNKGYATSYRVYIPQYKNFGNGLEEYNDAFKSACVTLNPNSTISTADSASMSLLGSMSFPDPVNGLGIMLRLYYSQNACDDSTGFDDVVIGSNDTPRTKSFIYATGQAINRTFYSTPESEVCKGPRLTTANVYAGGVGLNYSPSYICTAEQFNNISQNYGSGSEAQSFMLMRDIDFGFGAFNPIGHTIDATYSYESTPYTGIFYGNNKTLSNIFIRNANSISSGGYIGVFRKVGTPPISIDHIANLTINRAAIIGFEKFNRVGLLAGFMQDSSVSNIKLFGHAEGSGVVGGMVGELSSSSTTIAINDVAAEVDVKGKIDVIDGNNNGVGGLVGYKSGSTAANFNRIAVKPQIHNDGGEYYVDVPIALYTGLTTGTQYCLDSTCTSGYFSVNEKITTSASTYLIKISGNNNLNFTSGTVYSTGGVYIGTSNSAVKIAGIGGLVGYIGGSATSLIDNVIVKSAEIDGPMDRWNCWISWNSNNDCQY